MSIRSAKHCGSWYSDSANDLSKQLESWLKTAQFIHGPARAIITPHAGYRYSGACAAHAYKQIKGENIKKVFILGPSHHYGLAGCALSKVASYKTPLFDLPVDAQINEELYSTGHFEWLKLDVEEKEHSIEMQLPFLAKVMENFKGHFTIVPILVGSISQEKQQFFGQILAKYLANSDILFVISSDFCHWGHQFRFTYIDASFKHIFDSIENLDRMGMKAIENLSPSEFGDYLKKYGNTICGRHVIGILLYMAQEIQWTNRLNLKFINYTQSNRCVSNNDSSVSYAAGVLTIE